MPASKNLHMKRLMHRSIQQNYSITSSARESRIGGIVRPKKLRRYFGGKSFFKCWSNQSIASLIAWPRASL